MIGIVFEPMPDSLEFTAPSVDGRSGIQRLMAISRDQDGIFTVPQARQAGITRGVLDRLARDGLIVRECRGAYRLAGVELGRRQRYRLAVLATGGALSHGSAARVWGYGLFDTPVHVTVARTKRAPSRSWLEVHSTNRRPSDLEVIRLGLPVTRPLRTLLDLAGSSVEDDEVRGFLDHCIAERHFAFATFERFLEKHAGKQRGVVRLKGMLPSATTIDSVAEAELLRVLVAAGIERPVAGLDIYDGGRFVGRADLAWEAQRVVLEMDGYAYHSGQDVFVADRERGNRIVAAGWVLLRVTPASLRKRPRELCAAVTAALTRHEATRMPA